jgi:hypothetical protein
MMANLFAFTRGPLRQVEWGDVCLWHKADIPAAVSDVL